jgi:hypothetical protein
VERNYDNPSRLAFSGVVRGARRIAGALTATSIIDKRRPKANVAE